MNTITHSSLGPRLDAGDALALATVIEETPAALEDPRMESALLKAIYSTPAPRLIVAWADGSIGFAFFNRGQSVAESLSTAYSAARGALEALHLQDVAPAGAHH